ncbi:DUF2268 domain-containing protein [Candidatus Woesearchaeota archaeon]|nr:DUF2268 domain-containing protein [Candidatus Woesearchaeota archaeon]
MDENTHRFGRTGWQSVRNTILHERFGSQKPLWYDAKDTRVILGKGVTADARQIVESELYKSLDDFFVPMDSANFKTAQLSGFVDQQGVIAYTKLIGQAAGRGSSIYIVPARIPSNSYLAPRQLGQTGGMTDAIKGTVVVPMENSPLGLELLRYTLRHELGHLFGLLGHHDLLEVADIESGELIEKPYIVDFGGTHDDAKASCIMRAGISTAPVDYCIRCKSDARDARSEMNYWS